MELERLYTLDPYRGCPAGAATFHGACVTRDAEPAAADRRAGRAHRGLRNLMEATTTTATSCFDAIHGATFRGAHGSFDVLVSLGCGNYRIYGQSREEVVGDAFEGAEAKPWFAAFGAAGLLKPRPIPPP